MDRHGSRTGVLAVDTSESATSMAWTVSSPTRMLDNRAGAPPTANGYNGLCSTMGSTPCHDDSFRGQDTVLSVSTLSLPASGKRPMGAPSVSDVFSPIPVFPSGDAIEDVCGTSKTLHLQLHNTSDRQPKTYRGGELQFPWMLHQLLEDSEASEYNNIISWMPCGRLFKVHDREEFTKRLLPGYVRQSKYKSFARSLNLWGFTTCRRCCGAENRGAYFHPKFARGDTDAAHEMVRIKIKAERSRRKCAYCSYMNQNRSLQTASPSQNGVSTPASGERHISREFQFHQPGVQPVGASGYGARCHDANETAVFHLRSFQEHSMQLSNSTSNNSAEPDSELPLGLQNLSGNSGPPATPTTQRCSYRQTPPTFHNRDRNVRTLSNDLYTDHGMCMLDRMNVQPELPPPIFGSSEPIDDIDEIFADEDFAHDLHRDTAAHSVHIYAQSDAITQQATDIAAKSANIRQGMASIFEPTLASRQRKEHSTDIKAMLPTTASLFIPAHGISSEDVERMLPSSPNSHLFPGNADTDWLNHLLKMMLEGSSGNAVDGVCASANASRGWRDAR